MTEDINYHNLADYIKGTMDSEHSDIIKDTAAATLANWLGRFYFKHSSNAVTLHQLEKFNTIGLENNFNIIRCLLKNGLVKHIKAKDKKTSLNQVYYAFTFKLYSLKNDYIKVNEQEWKDYERWNTYFVIYKENEMFYDEIEAFLKTRLKYDNKQFEKAISIKNDYIHKIAYELDYEKRIELKNKALLEIDQLIYSN